MREQDKKWKEQGREKREKEGEEETGQEKARKTEASISVYLPNCIAILI